MFKNFKKKGYYFIIDALIGSTIIFLSLLVIINGGVKPTKIQYNYEMAEEYNTFILTTKIQDLQNPYVKNLYNLGIITDKSLTIMEQVDLFYYKNTTLSQTYARKMIENLTESLIPDKYGFSYRIIDGATTTDIYNNTDKSVANIEDAKIVIASRKITFVQINSSTMFGPAMTEIKIWI